MGRLRVPMGIGDVVLLALFVCLVTTGLWLLATANARHVEARAQECSELLHGYEDGTIVPLTDSASVEIGACLLQFNQPLGGGG